jgi:uncharacterized protein (TIGR02246 family)
MVTLLLAAILSGCGVAAHRADPTKSAAAVRALEGDVLKAWHAKDAAGVVRGYAPDATVYMAGQPPVEGRAALQKLVTQMLGDPNFSMNFQNQTTIVGSGDDVAYAKGIYRVTFTDPKTKKVVTENGHYVTLFRKGSDGAWEAAEDIPIASAPAA